MANRHSPKVQTLRLAAQRCPMHGLRFDQISAWLSSMTGNDEPEDYALACCPRWDCEVVAKVRRADFEAGSLTIVAAPDVDPVLWAQAAAWVDHKRTSGSK